MGRWRWLLPRHLGNEADRATFRTLHTVSSMTGALRGGLTRESAEHAVRPLRSLLNAPAVALTDTDSLLAWDGRFDAHAAYVGALARQGVEDGTPSVHGHDTFPCGDPYCPIRKVVVSPLCVDERVIGTLQVFVPLASAALVRAVTELSSWVAGQVELAEVAAQRNRLMEAEMRALRAQISPHFVYNALTAIASFVRTDPDRARELLLDFADYTRHAFQRRDTYTTLEEELRSVERYLILEQARFGERLQVTLRIAPEVLPVTVPVLSLQPLVENAVRHGLADKRDGGTITILAEDHDREAVISVEDDGVGEDPERVRRALAGDTSLDSVGLGNVDERLRSAFGEDFGLVVETAPGAGTRVVVRVPKFAAGVRP